MSKILFGIRDKKIVYVSIHTTLDEKKRCFRETGCSTVIVADRTDEIYEAWIENKDVDISMFHGVEL